MNPASFTVHRDDGTSYVTSMARGTTIHQARRYLLGMATTTEDEDGRETVRRVIRVEPAHQPTTLTHECRRLFGSVHA